MISNSFLNERIDCSLRESELEGGLVVENHCHLSYELIAVFGGSVSIVIEGSRYTVSKGELVIIPPLCYHSIYTEGSTEYKRITALFGSSLIPEAISGDFSCSTAGHYIFSHKSLNLVMDFLYRAMNENVEAKYSALIESLLTQILYIVTYKSAARENFTSEPRVKRITEYIDAHICDKISLDELAREMLMSKSGVCHIFSSEMKVSVKQYIIQKKISYAAKLITEGVAAGEAAQRIGYDNYSDFYKMYRKHFGVSPSKK
jgi:AraC-like DNA-binding protein